MWDIQTKKSVEEEEDDEEAESDEFLTDVGQASSQPSSAR